MNAKHFLGIHVMWVVDAFAFVLLAFGLTVKVFRNRANVEPGLQQGYAADPTQVLRDNPSNPER